MAEHSEAKRALDQIHRKLDRINPRAARNLEGGLEDTLTVRKLRVPELLRKSLASTNIIESAFFLAEDLCRRGKRGREGDPRERWTGSALLLAEGKSSFNGVPGIPVTSAEARLDVWQFLGKR